MTEQTPTTAEGRVDTLYHNVTEMAHKAFQVSLGAVMLAQDEITDFAHTTRERAEQNWNKWWDEAADFTDKLVERGSEVEQDNRTRMEQRMEERRKWTNDWLKQSEKRFNSSVERFLSYAHIPTSQDLDSLGKKINSLGRKVDNMRKTQEKAIQSDVEPMVEVH